MTDDLAVKVARADLARRVWMLTIAALAILIVCLVVALLVEVRHTQIDGTPNGKKILAASERIESCTTPGQDCFEDGQKRTAAAVGSINTITVLAVTCSQQNPSGDLDQIQSCVKRLYAKSVAKP